MATDLYRALALECDDLPDDSLMLVFTGDVTPAEGDTTRMLMEKVAFAPTKLSPQVYAAFEATLLAYRKGTLDERADIIESFGCQVCNLGKNPSPIGGNLTLDAPVTITGSIYGGDFAGLGDPGCTAVRHEFRVTLDSEFGNSNNGVAIHSWEQGVVNQASFSQQVTLTSAQWAQLGSPPAVNVWLRSYTCGDKAFREDFYSGSVQPFAVAQPSVALEPSQTVEVFAGDFIANPGNYSDFSVSKDGVSYGASVILDCTDAGSGQALVYVKASTPSEAIVQTFAFVSDPGPYC